MAVMTLKETQTGTVKAHISTSIRTKRATKYFYGASKFSYGASKFSYGASKFSYGATNWMDSLEN